MVGRIGEEYIVVLLVCFGKTRRGEEVWFAVDEDFFCMRRPWPRGCFKICRRGALGELGRSGLLGEVLGGLGGRVSTLARRNDPPIEQHAEEPLPFSIALPPHSPHRHLRLPPTFLPRRWTPRPPTNQIQIRLPVQRTLQLRRVPSVSLTNIRSSQALNAAPSSSSMNCNAVHCLFRCGLESSAHRIRVLLQLAARVRHVRGRLLVGLVQELGAFRPSRASVCCGGVGGEGRSAAGSEHSSSSPSSSAAASDEA